MLKLLQRNFHKNKTNDSANEHGETEDDLTFPSGETVITEKESVTNRLLNISRV